MYIFKLYADDKRLIVELETGQDNDDMPVGTNRIVEFCETYLCN